MEFEEQDIDVIRLLAELKAAEEDYPVELLASRRQGFASQIAALTTSADVSAAIKAAFAACSNQHKVLNLHRIISSLPVVEQIAVRLRPGSAVPCDQPALICKDEPTQTTAEMSTAVVTSLPEMLFLLDTDPKRNW